MILSEGSTVSITTFLNLYKMVTRIISDPVKAIEEIKNNNRAIESIFTKADEAILYFPLITTNAISIRDLIMVSKALERQYTTFLRLAMGLENVIDNENVTSIGKFVKKFHTNLRVNRTTNLLRVNNSH